MSRIEDTARLVLSYFCCATISASVPVAPNPECHAEDVQSLNSCRRCNYTWPTLISLVGLRRSAQRQHALSEAVVRLTGASR